MSPDSDSSFQTVVSGFAVNCCTMALISTVPARITLVQHRSPEFVARIVNCSKTGKNGTSQTSTRNIPVSKRPVNTFSPISYAKGTERAFLVDPCQAKSSNQSRAIRMIRLLLKSDNQQSRVPAGGNSSSATSRKSPISLAVLGTLSA
jgi:hypothetical protein